MSSIKNNNNNNEHKLSVNTKFDGDYEHKSMVIVEEKGPNDRTQGYSCHKSPKHSIKRIKYNQFNVKRVTQGSRGKKYHSL